MADTADTVWSITLSYLSHNDVCTPSDIVRYLPEETADIEESTIRARLDAMVSTGALTKRSNGYSLSLFMQGGRGDLDHRSPTSNGHRSGNVNSVFPYPGGKGREADWILEKMPTHDTYVEVMGGSAALLYNKSPSQYEIYNDINNDLVQFFNTLRERTDELVEWVQAVPYSRSLYEEWADAFYAGERREDPIERAGRFFTLRYMQVVGDMTRNGFKTRAKRSPARTFDNARHRLYDIAERFSDVIIENRDYAKILEGYDDSEVDVLFYADPPYIDGENYYNVEFDHEEFIEAVLDVENDVMISYSALPEMVTATEEFTILSRDRRHRMKRGAGDVTEHIVCTFDPNTRPQFTDTSTEQLRLS